MKILYNGELNNAATVQPLKARHSCKYGFFTCLIWSSPQGVLEHTLHQQEHVIKAASCSQGCPPSGHLLLIRPPAARGVVYQSNQCKWPIGLSRMLGRDLTTIWCRRRLVSDARRGPMYCQCTVLLHMSPHGPKPHAAAKTNYLSIIFVTQVATMNCIQGDSPTI